MGAFFLSDIGTTFTYGEDAGLYALTGVTSSTLVIPVATQEATYISFDQISTIDEGNLIKQGWSERLSAFVGGQLIDYPYTFITSSVRYLSFGEGSFSKRLDNWYKVGFQTANAQLIMNGALDVGFYSIQKQIELFRLDKIHRAIDLEISVGNSNWYSDLQSVMFNPTFPKIPHFYLLPYTDPGSLIISEINY